MADMAVLNLSLVPELGLETYQGSHVLKPPSLHTSSKSSWGAGSRAHTEMLGLEKVNAVLEEHSNLLHLGSLSFPEELRWGRNTGSHLIQTPTQSRAHIGLPQVCMSQCWTPEAQFNPPHCELYFPSSRSCLCCSLGLLRPIPTLDTAVFRVGYISLNAVHTQTGKGTRPSSPLSPRYPE